MVWVDYAILGIIVVSALVSLIRGFVREAISLAVWIAAFWVGFSYSPAAAAWFDGVIEAPSLRVAAAFVVLFVVILFAGALINYVIGMLMRGSVLRGTDRTLGVVFGLIRGVVVAAVLITLISLTPLAQNDWWQDSALIALFQPLIDKLHELVPRDVRGAAVVPPPPQAVGEL